MATRKSSEGKGTLKVSPRVADQRRAKLAELVESLPEGRAAAIAGTRHLGLEVRGKRFGWYLHDHHGDGRLALNCKAPPGANRALAAAAPERFHLPKYVGNKGWVGLWLDSPKVDWSEVKALLVEAYGLAAPKSLALAILSHLPTPPASR